MCPRAAFSFLRLNSYALDIDLVLFGLWCALTGYLIFKSAFLPRILGVLLAIDGLGWMMFVVPPFASHISLGSPPPRLSRKYHYNFGSSSSVQTLNDGRSKKQRSRCSAQLSLRYSSDRIASLRA